MLPLPPFLVLPSLWSRWAALPDTLVPHLAQRELALVSRWSLFQRPHLLIFPMGCFFATPTGYGMGGMPENRLLENLGQPTVGFE